MTLESVRLRALAVAMAAVVLAGCTAVPTTHSYDPSPDTIASSPLARSRLSDTRNPPITSPPTPTLSKTPRETSSVQRTPDLTPTTHAPTVRTTHAPALATHAPAAPTPHAPATSVRTSPATRTAPASFVGSIADIDSGLARRMATSWRPGCPVPLADLSYLRLSYVDFHGDPHIGELVVARSVANQMVAVFRQLYRHRFPIRRMSLVDDFGGSDNASMAADNTSGFNCRPSTGSSSFSQHSYGLAVDVNPTENPYVGDGTVLPPAGSAFASRPDEPGVLHDDDVVVLAFASIGWHWGGEWNGVKDYQHFSADGR